MASRTRPLLVLVALATLALPATPQTEQEQNRRRQEQASYEHRRRERQRDRVYSQHFPGYGRNKDDLRAAGFGRRYSSETRPSFVSITTLAAPKLARRAYRKAQDAAALPDLEVAAEHLDQAIALYPDYAAAWSLLGRVRVRTGDHGQAVQALQRSIEIDAKYLEPYPDLAYLTVTEGRWLDVVRLADQMIKVNPLFTLGHYYRGYALLQQGQLQIAEKALSTALSTPDASLFPDVHYVLGEVYRSQASYPLAAREYVLYTAAVSQGAWAEEANRWLEDWRILGVIP